ncbi:MAG TPA: hypothetical protein VJW76_04430, partial [Verrucomicrobiae bacterium]|nr:hypothetical protein [Verrucomicrobiae bacterium]
SRRVNLTTSAQSQGTNYTVNVSNVSDEAGALIPANSPVNFTAWKVVSGWVTREVYLGIPGAFVADLTTAPKYPDNPDQVTWSKTFELNNEPLLNQYGARLSAFLTPAVNGAHELFLNNDDEAEILLSTDQSSANLQSLGLFPLNAPPFDTAGFVTSPALTANQRYLLVGLVKQDGGDVYIQIGARPPGSAQAPETLPVLGGNLISTFINPDIGNVTFKQQPTNVTTAAGSRARFAVKVETEENPVYFQWRSGGTNIPGAIRSAYVTPVLTTGDSGKTYDVVVSVAGKDTTSAAATLTVVAGQPSNLQPYLGINFVGGGGGGPGGPMSAVDVAGVVLQENWNNLAGFAFDPATTPITLVAANGANTPVTLTLAATESWYSGTLASGDANGALLQGFVDTMAVTDPMVITLSNVPSGPYNVLVYSLGFDFSASYEQQFSVMGDGVHPSYHGKAETGLTYLQNPAFRRMLSTNPATPDAGNYVQFDNVNPATDGSLAILVMWESTNPGNGHQPAVNAIQLVRVNPVTETPSLGATIGAPGSLTLSWPASAAGFTLEASATVGPGASWTAVAGAPNPITTAGAWSVGIGATNRFFRLRQ